MQSKTMINTKKVKLGPVQNTGDCGYHTVIIGLFYLALKAAENDNVAFMINSSKAISTLLSEQTADLKKYLKKPFKTNHECLLSYLDAMATTNIHKPMFVDILLNFTFQLKKINGVSGWLEERVKNELKSGLWMESNRAWDKLPSFENIMNKIRIKASDLYAKATATKSCQFDNDLLYEMMFQAQIETCNVLTDEELTRSAKEVIAHFYRSDDPVWIDSEFLKSLVSNLFGTSDMIFHKNSLTITGGGPTQDHWYIELPYDQYTQTFISIYKMGYQSGLNVVLPETKIEVTLSSYSSLFPPTPKRDEKDNVFFPTITF